MVKAKESGLEQAMILLIQNQPAFLSQITAMNARMDQRFAQTDDRFARIEKELAEIKDILLKHEELLLDHDRLLKALPDTIRQKIGFEPQ